LPNAPGWRSMIPALRVPAPGHPEVLEPMVAIPQPAATVILLRDGPRSPEVLLIERHARSPFLPAMYVFPGGRVEACDLALVERIGSFSAAVARERLPTVPADLALGYFVAAVRETFEEAGILLARRRGSTDLLGHDVALQERRLAVQSSPAAFRELIESQDLELDLGGLAVHGHWITPERVERRFDTVFFSALAPQGQLAQHDGVESTAHQWVRPEDALEQALRGERQIIFPTACNLETLCGFADAAAALRASHARPVVPVLPRVVQRDARRVLELPPDSGYRAAPEFSRPNVVQ
jgi:8-oxo-dGTP pyrophosphatase MutT (NUDIX family)